MAETVLVTAPVTTQPAVKLIPEPEVQNPHDLITEKDVQIALTNDKGPEATLKIFHVKDFTKQGDNYVCSVTSVQIVYTIRKKRFETSYVVKLNPCRPANGDLFTMVLFEKEIGFYTQLLPMLNDELEKIGEQKLRVPTYLHCVEKAANEVIYLKDLRRGGYIMVNRKKSLDKEHTEMVITELARLHASSALLLSRNEFKDINVLERYPILKETFSILEKRKSTFTVKVVYPGIVQNIINIVSRCKGYEKVVEFLKSIKYISHELYAQQFEVTEQFKVIGHGDSWNNNFLFRYSSDGSVQDCRLLDMQYPCVVSPTLDLNYLLYSGLDGDVRRTHLPFFLSRYHETFSSVLAKAGQSTKFTLPELNEEFHKKNTFGMLMSLLIIPMLMAESAKEYSLDDLLDAKNGHSERHREEKVMENMLKNPLVKTRLLAMFDDMLESGLIPTY